MQRYLLIAIGGALGAIARYQIGALAAERFSMRFPVGTLVVNMTACFLIGFSVEFLNRHANINPAWRYLIPVGFIGAYSTFSTYEWEIWMDFTSGAFWTGCALHGRQPCGGTCRRSRRFCDRASCRIEIARFCGFSRTQGDGRSFRRICFLISKKPCDW